MEELTLPGLSSREIYEGMTPNAIVDQILHLGQKVSQFEREMNMAADVLEGVYGVTVLDVLELREKEKQNGEQN